MQRQHAGSLTERHKPEPFRPVNNRRQVQQDSRRVCDGVSVDGEGDGEHP